MSFFRANCVKSQSRNWYRSELTPPGAIRRTVSTPNPVAKILQSTRSHQIVPKRNNYPSKAPIVEPIPPTIAAIKILTELPSPRESVIPANDCWWTTYRAPAHPAKKPAIENAVNFALMTLTPYASTPCSLSRRAMSTRPVRLCRKPWTIASVRKSEITVTK